MILFALVLCAVAAFAVLVCVGQYRENRHQEQMNRRWAERFYGSHRRPR